MDVCCQVMAHELLHAFDKCRAKFDITNVEHLACTEVYSYKLNNNLKTCTYKKVYLIITSKYNSCHLQPFKCPTKCLFTDFRFEQQTCWDAAEQIHSDIKTVVLGSIWMMHRRYYLYNHMACDCLKIDSEILCMFYSVFRLFF